MAALSQTMTGQDLTAAQATTPPTALPPSGAPEDMTAEQKMVQAWMDQLTSQLNAIPNVNVAEKMQPLLDAAKAQKVPEKANPLMMGIAAFGAPEMTPSLAQHNDKIDTIQRAKDAQMLQMQQSIIGAQIEQDMAEGKFKKALEQSKVLQLMKPQLDAYERKQAMDEFTTKEDIKQKGRVALAKERGAQARATLQDRAKALTKGMSIDERILMAQINHISDMQEIALQRAASYDPLSQSWTVNPTDFEAIAEQGNASLEAWINSRRPRAATAPGAAPVAPAAPAQSAAERIRAAAGR